jgi:two-component system heavy metal sensor histidine kinase CusS
VKRRLTLLILAIVALALAGLSLALYVSVRRAAWAAHDRTLAERARALGALVEYDDGYEFELAGAELAGLGLASHASYFEVWAPDGTVIARSLSLESGDLPRLPGVRDLPLPDGRPGRAIGVSVAPLTEDGHAPPPGFVLIVLAEDVADVHATLSDIRSDFWLAGAIALALVAVAAIGTVSRGLAPLGRLASALEKIDDRHLAERLPADGQPPELALTVRTLNDLLARLDASFTRERRFTADVSHELRTPLAGLRTILDVTAQRERSGDEYRRAIGEAQAIAVQLSGLVEHLLLLARLDAGAIAVRRSEISLRELVDACWRTHAEAAAARGLDWRNRVPDDAVVESDRDKLQIVVDNLLRNAVAYTEAGGWIEVTTPAGAVLDVADSGPPLPADQLERVFERFWRADASRAGAHSGIGLSLARTLAGTLGYTLTAASPGGTVRFRLARA